MNVFELNDPAREHCGGEALMDRAKSSSVSTTFLAALVISVGLMSVPVPSQAGSCGVPGKKLWCTNRVTPMYDKPSINLPPSTKVDTLWTTYSYFLCWSEGQIHLGNNYTWYKTVGDQYGRTGWVPAYKLDTSSKFDSNPSKYGLPACSYNWN
jgi:hypothetical protein